LSALYDAGFLKFRKEGLWSLYAIDDGMEDYLSDMVSAAKKSLIENKEAKMDRERLKTTKRTGMACTSCVSESIPVFQGKN
jgi:DNA-binding transcriptional ArsR family regulator